MSRVKRGKIAIKKRREILKQVKGFKWGRKLKERAAKEALLHAWPRAFRGRKEKKRSFRELWQVKINAAVKQEGIAYSKFMAALKKNNIKLDRKILAELAEKKPEVFKKIVGAVRGL
jgi:large subunit ribosomal protein L20